MKKPQLIIALDVDTPEEAGRLVDALSGVIDIFKIGSQLFTACGPEALRMVSAKGKKVFLDLKYHDIPNTVAGAVRAAAGQGIFMYTVHTLGGEEMLKAAVQAASESAAKLRIPKALGVGITVLTSEEKRDNIQNLVLERALLAKKSGLDGVVASAQEAELIRRELGRDFIIVTPGIRPSRAHAGDQKRTATPSEAVSKGSHFLVVGRPVIGAADPAQAAEAILAEIKTI
jgi:orotidine-5'-phosphate decarboxylase